MRDSLSIYNAISCVDGDLIEEAGAFRPRRRGRWAKWAAVAALAAGAAAAIFLLAPPTPRETPGSPGQIGLSSAGPMPSAGVSGYAGPILPLTVSDPGALTARRDTMLDFSGWADTKWPHSVLVTDGFTVTNPTAEDVTVTAYYPFIGSLAAPDIPEITVDGAAAETVLRSGPYLGGFTGGEDPKLLEPGSFEAYAAALSGVTIPDDGEDLAVFQTPVTVYELRGARPVSQERYYSVLEADFTYDAAETTVFLCGFNGDGFTVEQPGNRRLFGVTGGGDDLTRYIIAVGPDISGLAVQGYMDAACREGEEWEIETDLIRYETTLGDIFDTLAARFAAGLLGEDLPEKLNADIDEELFILEARRCFALYSRLGSDPSPRYATEQLERLLHDTLIEHRVMYLEFPLTVPAGGEVTVTSRQSKSAGAVYSAAEGGAVSRCDIASDLGSALTFTSVTASLTGAEKMSFIQNTLSAPSPCRTVAFKTNQLTN